MHDLSVEEVDDAVGKACVVLRVSNLAVYAPLALAVARFAPGGVPGLVWLWLAFTIGFMGARAATLWWRERSDAWLVTG